MFWKITKDIIGDEPDAVGVHAGTQVGDKLITFKIYDDDGEHYYTGQCDVEAFMSDEGDGALYNALQWACHNAGATDLRLKLADVLELVPSGRMNEIYTSIARSDGWVSIYG